MSKKFLPLISFVLIVAFALASCAPKTPAVTETTAPVVTESSVATTEAPAKPVTINIWHLYSGDYLTAITQVFKDYEAAHPGVTIDLSKPDDVTASLKVAIPAGEGPDILAWANDQIGVNAIAGNIVDLGTQGITMDWLKSIYEPAGVSGVVYQNKIWALPETQEGIALIVNTAVVDPKYLPTDPMNFADLLAKIKQFKADFPNKDLLCNQGFPGGDAYHIAPIYFGFGVPQYVDDSGKAYLNTPEALKAATYIQELSKVLPKEETQDICKAGFIEGKIGIFWTGPWSIADIEKAGVKYSILPMGKPFVGIKVYMLTQNAVDRGNAAVALDIMKYFTSADVQAKLAVINKTIPAQTAALADPNVKALTTLAGFGVALNLGVPMGNSPFANAQWGPVGDATGAIWNGSQTPEAAMAAAQAAIEAAVASMK